MPIRVVLAEDNLLVREGLRQLLATVEDMFTKDHGGRSLRNELRMRMDPFDTGDNDYRAAIAYLSGKQVEGARYELEASLGFYVDRRGSRWGHFARASRLASRPWPKFARSLART